jgi:phage shock protein A
MSEQSIWSRLFTAIRGGVTEVGESIADGQSVRILDQEIRDADSALSTAKQDLAKIMGKEKLASARLVELKAKVVELEGHAIAALDKGLEDLAIEVAEAIATVTSQRDAEEAQVKEFSAYTVRMRNDISKAESRITSLRSQVDRVKARESVQRAQISVSKAGGNANGKLSTAASTLANLQKRQDETAAVLEAQEELAETSSGADLDRKLKEANILPNAGSANSILENLRNRSKQ